ncbi:flagellar hook-basal body complex protein FliE [Paenibacillus sp. y28]|uniref:flagellar hook-basal body complex protein FliE n=1 Tax=Paenibacillus sp. y28 TaxID=3129110 RepID=UPI003016E436
MDIKSVAGLSPMAAAKPAAAQQPGAVELSKQFGEYLSDALGKVNEQQAQVDKLSGQFVSGELADVHQLLIASEKASLGLELTVQIRNKVIEAYQDIMRTQL